MPSSGIGTERSITSAMSLSYFVFLWHWKINNLCYESKLICVSFVSVCFCWVLREANSLAGSLAKVVASQIPAFVCNKHSLPPSAV
jgi:hypothetical protein